jgi:hypothetical protein
MKSHGGGDGGNVSMQTRQFLSCTLRRGEIIIVVTTKIDV